MDVKEMQAVLDKSLEAFNSKLIGFAKSEDLKAEFDGINKSIKALTDENIKATVSELEKSIEALGLKVSKFTANAPKQDITMVSEIESQKDGIAKAVNKEVKEHEFQITAADTTRSSVTNSTQALRLLDIGQLATKRLTAYDVFQKVPVGSGSNGVVRYADWDLATTVRAAAMIAEGGTFPESTAKWEEFSLNLRKIGDTIPVTEEMVMDAPRFAAELDSFLRTNISLIENAQLTKGAGTGQNLTGVYTSAPTYTAVASGISDASIYDLIVVMRSAITGPYGSKYNPDFAFMNISDINKMKLKKDANENYIIPPFVDRNGQQVDGVVVIENNDITADTLVLGDSMFGKIYEVEGVTVSTGYTGDQFAEDLMTLKARKREALLIRNVDKTGFLKCTGIAAALVTLAS